MTLGGPIPKPEILEVWFDEEDNADEPAFLKYRCYACHKLVRVSMLNLSRVDVSLWDHVADHQLAGRARLRF